jgi:hypothetical protein
VSVIVTDTVTDTITDTIFNIKRPESLVLSTPTRFPTTLNPLLKTPPTTTL